MVTAACSECWRGGRGGWGVVRVCAGGAGRGQGTWSTCWRCAARCRTRCRRRCRPNLMHTNKCCFKKKVFLKMYVLKANPAWITLVYQRSQRIENVSKSTDSDTFGGSVGGAVAIVVGVGPLPPARRRGAAGSCAAWASARRPHAVPSLHRGPVRETRFICNIIQ